MPALPRFSVVICNYNYAAFVGEAIQSVLDQTYSVELVQVIVVDDGSTDDSRQVIEAFRENPRIRIVLQENRGQSAAYAAGVSVAEGDFVCLLDSDDLYLPIKLERLADKLVALGWQAGASQQTELFVCHDLVVHNAILGGPSKQSWFEVIGINKLPDCLTLADSVQSFPFSIPCGAVFSRALIAAVLEALPCWAFLRGTDGVLCPAAFLKTGKTYYLREQLGVYRIHGGNELGSLSGDRYVPKIDLRPRVPKTLHFLYQWLDGLALDSLHRAQALGYLRRLEHLNRSLPTAREMDLPLVSLVILCADHGVERLYAEQANLQSHGRVETCVVENSRLSEIDQLAQGYWASSAEYVVFVRGVDRLDREFVERHLFWRQQAALVGVSCSDIRLASGQGSLVQADVFRNSGAWKQPLQQIPPLATQLKDWVAPPMSACMFRRSEFLDQVFSRREQMPESLRNSGFWLIFQIQHHTAGVLRILETLTTFRLPQGAAATYGYLSTPCSLTGDLVSPPISEALIWLATFANEEQALFRQWLPPAWHQRFAQWQELQSAGRSISARPK